jgi:hypothetical protein
MVRIDPQTGRAFEENPEQLPGGLSGDYRTQNCVWSAQNRTVRQCGARNEVVAFQVIIEGRAKKVTVEASPLAGAGGSAIDRSRLRLFREWYVPITDEQGNKKAKGCMLPLGGGWYADAAIPLSTPKVGNGFAIPSRDFHDPSSTRFCDQKNQAIWVDVHIPDDAKPGDYTGTITVTADGHPQSIALRLTVWDFAIPRKMNMHAELMNYGATAKEPDTEMMYNYFRLACEHRAVISDNRVKPPYDGGQYDWQQFDRRFGPLFDGSVFSAGPCKGLPIPLWIMPVEYSVDRTADKPHKTPFKDWPLTVRKTPTGYGVVFDEPFRSNLAAAISKFHDHFAAKGWNATHVHVWQDSLDEPGFHKSGQGLKAGAEQAVAIYETAKIVTLLARDSLSYRLDIGSGNINNKLDLDGDGKQRGAYDVAAYFGPVVDFWSVSGLRIVLAALKPQMAKHGVRACFYNGYHPRVASNAIYGELLGFRMWAVAAWRSGLVGWADWQFRKEDGKKVFYEMNDDGRNMYFYRGEYIGVPGSLFASLRLKSVRRGAQDFEMLRLLAERDGSDRRSQALASTVTGAGFTDVETDIKEVEHIAAGLHRPYTGQGKETHWSHHPEDWAKFHRALGEMLSGNR